MLVSQALEVLSTGDLSFEALDIGDGFLLGARNLLAVPEVDGVARAGVRLEDVQAADLTFRYGARYLTFCLDSLVFHILVSCFLFALPILGRAFLLLFSALGLSSRSRPTYPAWVIQKPTLRRRSLASYISLSFLFSCCILSR